MRDGAVVPESVLASSPGLRSILLGSVLNPGARRFLVPGSVLSASSRHRSLLLGIVRTSGSRRRPLTSKQARYPQVRGLALFYGGVCEHLVPEASLLMASVLASRSVFLSIWLASLLNSGSRRPYYREVRHPRFRGFGLL